MLELIDVHVTAEDATGTVSVLQGINLTLEDNKIYVMTGPNGGGKTSIAKTIMGIYRPSRGRVLLDGADITEKSITERARLGIGYAFQQPPRFKGIKVKDLLKIAAGNNADNRFQCDLLYDVGLCAQDYLEREINSSFSGGELKRIEIASLLARKLKVAIFDEPEAGIDLWSFQKLIETFAGLREKYQGTLVIISHQERILRLADQVILVNDGRISETTTPEKFLAEIEIITADCRCRTDCIKGEVANA
ncbi:MAG: ATP-binding cassette domain-containing protein [Firmicutes bacterium]|mgnify:CR=1 FL=1|nr:ATP-binding cassette domain-containing protein [Bacillota bacterium]